MDVILPSKKSIASMEVYQLGETYTYFYHKGKNYFIKIFNRKPYWKRSEYNSDKLYSKDFESLKKDYIFSQDGKGNISLNRKPYIKFKLINNNSRYDLTFDSNNELFSYLKRKEFSKFITL